MQKAYFNWSSGKDSALALYYAIRSERYSIETLFSAVTSDCEKVSMHEVGVDLLKRQAEAIGIPLTIFSFDPLWTKTEYENAMSEQVREWKEQGFHTALFGDIYLERQRKNRTHQCEKAGITAEFPLWNIPTEEVIRAFIQLGFKAIVTCVDNAVLSESWLGKMIDEDFLGALPANADICGENGEYHSFVFDGPIFHRPAVFGIKRKFCRDYPDLITGEPHRYWYLELE